MSCRRADTCPLRASHADAGLQPERTFLAWGRTLLVLLVIACVFLRWIQIRGWLGAMLALLCLLAALYIWVAQRRRYRLSVLAIHTGYLRANVRAVLFIGMMVASLAMMSMWAVLGGA